MRRFRLIGVALLAVFALGVVVASSAQAETAPSWTVGGARLEAGKTHNIDSRLYKENFFKLTNSTRSTEITCKALGTEKAVLLGSNPGLPGTDDEITVFSQCELVKGNGAPACELSNATGQERSSVIATEPTKSEQVENVVENSKAGSQLLEEFYPANPANGFVDIHFRGSGCTADEDTVSGQTVAEVVLDNTSEGKVELGQAPQERTSWLLRFPSTPISRVWLISGTGGHVALTKQVSFGAQGVQLGTALVLLANTKGEPEPNGLWSPLP